MELKPGFKLTEIGVFPEDWTTAALGEMAIIERGKFSARPRNDPKFYGGDIPFLQTGDVTRSGGVIERFTQTLNADGLRVSRLFPKGTLFFTIAANIGDVGITEFDAACPDSLVAVSPRSCVDKQWLFYELASRKAEFESLASPGAQLNINLEKLLPYLLPVPPSEEQRNIGEALSDIDALLSGLDRLIAKKSDLKQAAMQQLLTGKTRLPGFEGEWRVGTFGDVVASLDAGVSVNSTDTTPSNDVPCVLKTSALVGGDFLSAEVKVIETHDVPRARTNPKRDTILISRMNTPMLVGEVAYVDQDYDWIFLPDRVWMARFNPVSKVCARWLAFVLSSRTYRDMLREVATGTSGSMKNISKGALLPLPINFPSAEEQIAIASVLADMDAELEALEARRDKTRALKQGMMQELLTGRTRLV